MKLPQVEARRAGLCFHTRRAVAEHGTGRCQLLPLPTRVFPLTIMHSTPLQENIFTFFYQNGNPRAFCEVRGEASHLVLEGCKPQPPIKQTSRLRTWHRKAQKNPSGGGEGVRGRDRHNRPDLRAGSELPLASCRKALLKR